jgi:hypothetical protein
MLVAHEVIVVDCCFVAQRGYLAKMCLNMMGHPTMATAILVHPPISTRKIQCNGLGSKLCGDVTRI